MNHAPVVRVMGEVTATTGDGPASIMIRLRTKNAVPIAVGDLVEVGWTRERTPDEICRERCAWMVEDANASACIVLCRGE